MEQQKSEKLHTSLTTEQVQEKIAAGLVNGETDIRTKSYQQILSDNLFSLFNLVNVILLVCILISGSLKNALFFLVVIWNFLIGTIQEIRAKKTIEKLSLLSAPKASVIRDGTVQEIGISGIVLGEIMQLKTGNQILADAVVLDGSCHVNESLITGESDPVYKTVGDHLISGSFLVSGHVTAEAEHIGNENYAAKITQGAKYFKKPDSVIIRSVRSVVRIIAIALIPLAGLLVWNNFFRVDLPFQSAMVKTVAAVSSMIPGGLVLLVSIVLAVSVVRLSLHHTLVQDLYCVENLARVDMLLLDKTGTITEGIMKVESFEVLSDTENILSLLHTYFQISDDDNATSSAIREYVDQNFTAESGSIVYRKEEAVCIPFSSERKWAMTLIPEKTAFLLGAPDYILGEQFRRISDLVMKHAESGKRVVLFADSSCSGSLGSAENLLQHPKLPDQIRPLALFILSDPVRCNAPEILQYFAGEGVSIKVISGDQPLTVSQIAEEAGVIGADQVMDASTLRTEQELFDASEKYTVFGRVSPDQKYQFVKALKKQGHVVAMTGDGANDVLALREADCSVAMQSGSDAARNVANIVLLDSDFSSLPLILAEGRKSINNLQRSAGLYLTKTVYSFIFAILFLFAASIIYPFENIQITLIGAVSIGIPSFFLALEPRSERIRDHFLRNVFLLAVPSGVLEAAGLLTALWIFETSMHLESAACSSAATYLMLIMGICAIFNLCGKLNLWKILLLVFLVIIAGGAVLVLPGLFSLQAVSWEVWKVILLISAVFFVIHGLIIRLGIPLLDNRKMRSKKSV